MRKHWAEWSSVVLYNRQTITRFKRGWHFEKIDPSSGTEEQTNMRLHWEPITLELRTTFRVAHGASDQRHNVLVYLDDGVGEAAAVPYYGETQEGIIEYLKSVRDLGDDPFALDEVLARRPPGSRAARSAIDEALARPVGQKTGTTPV
jgi:L-alanine-DL-glutamate epimerase-like enolase superfamily enzyme